MKYFRNYAEDPGDLADIPSENERVADPSGPFLPFDYLPSRTFETLAYRLLSAECPQDHFVLMGGTGERGRDILHFATGRLKSIIQCKNFRDPVDAGRVRQELLKIALHSYLDPTILAKDTSYQLWCPRGLTEEAANLIATWPERWTESAIRSNVERVMEKYNAFADLTWDAVKTFVLQEFPSLVRPTTVDNTTLAARLRKQPAVYEQFFGGKVVVAKADLKAELADIASRANALTDDDARRMIDRIQSFSQDERVLFISTLLLGISPALVAKFRRHEYQELATIVFRGPAELCQLLLTVFNRLQTAFVADFRQQVPSCHPALPQLLRQLLSYTMLSKIVRLTMPKMAPEGWKTYAGRSLDERLQYHVELTYEDYTACIAAYDAKRHAPGSDEETRYRIGTHGLMGATSLEEYKEALQASVVTHRSLLDSIYRDWCQLIPRQFLMVHDSVSGFEDSSFFRRMVDNEMLIARLRGSHIVPE